MTVLSASENELQSSQLLQILPVHKLNRFGKKNWNISKEPRKIKLARDDKSIPIKYTLCLHKHLVCLFHRPVKSSVFIPFFF